ncbi:hypothetical protein EVJ58_g4094 [Rhodofomes roseus]|uniref:CENP-V/GFA domain-containing protein n=1 Tax=Rhodofomes roseus TaxID=34475 RepID=A0A4Y9YJU3_9APHY|nr:hypothetical protein EVJ58_g4094 [Rhodofomes roseus]
MPIVIRQPYATHYVVIVLTSDDHDSEVFSYLGFVSRENLKILQGEPKGYKQPAEAARSGKEVIRYFCGDCGTPLWAAAESAPETYSIKLAMFGNSLPPAMEIFWKHAHDWQKPIVPAEMVFEEWY